MKPRWFQLHLSTCVVLMFVAAGLCSLNIIPRPFIDRSGQEQPWITRQGFPMTFKVHFTPSKAPNRSTVWRNEDWTMFISTKEKTEIVGKVFQGIDYIALVGNIVISCTLVIVVAVVAERRGGSRLTSSHSSRGEL